MTSLAQELNLELALRIELAEARGAVGAAEAMARRRPELGVGVLEVGGGYAVYCGANSPLTQAVGVGLSGAVNAEDFDRLEEFFFSRKEPVRVETCPLADVSLIDQFGKHGYRVTEFTNVMARPLSEPDRSVAPLDLADGLTIERVGEGQFDLWAFTVAQGFAEEVPMTQEILQLMGGFAGAPNVECYLAKIDGEIAGGATLVVRDRVAGLFGASTLPAFRKRGVQTALLNKRILRAAESGCDITVCLAHVGGSSQRNVVRLGFDVLYTRVKFERDAPSA